MKMNLNLLSIFRDWRLVREMKEKPWLISRVANPSEWVQMTAVKKDASFIGLIAHTTEKVQMTVVKNYRGSICHIQYPTENVQLYVVKGNPKEIRNIQRPTERVQLAAVRKDPYVITEIMRPCQEACKEAIKKYFGDIGPVNNSPALVVATQKLFKQLLEIEKIYCKMKGDAFLTDNPSGKARLVDEIRLVDKADWFRVEKISQALLVFKEEAGIILSQHNDRSRSELKQPVPIVNNNKKEITINH